MNQDSMDDIDAKLWSEEPRNRGLIARRNKRLTSSLKYPDLLSGPPSFLCNVYRWDPSLWTFQLEREYGHSLPYSAKVTNGWNYTPPPPSQAFNACTRKLLKTYVQGSFSKKNIKKCSPATISNYYWFLQRESDVVKKINTKSKWNYAQNKVVQTVSKLRNQ